MIKHLTRKLSNFANGEKQNFPLLLIIFFALGIAIFFKLKTFFVYAIIILCLLLFICSLFSNTIRKVILRYNLLTPMKIIKFVFFKILKFLFLLILLPLFSQLFALIFSITIVLKVFSYLRYFMSGTLFRILWSMVRGFFSILPLKWLTNSTPFKYLMEMLSQPFFYFRKFIESLKSIKKKLTKYTIKLLDKYNLQGLKRILFPRQYKHNHKIPYLPSFKYRPATFFGYLILSFALGISTMYLHTVLNKREFLRYPVFKKDFEAHIEQIQVMDKSRRLVLNNLKALNKDGIQYVKRIRLKVNENHENLDIGQNICFRATLFPLSNKSTKHGFDFKTYAYYKNIDAVGYIDSGIEIIDTPPLNPKEKIEKFRYGLIKKMLKGENKEERLFATTLITGERYAMPEDSDNSFKQAGISHLLSVSGFHMGLLTIICFFIFRYSLLLISNSQLKDTKKIAAVITFFITLAYFFISGSAVPIQRTFIMTTIGLIAILLNRRGISLNNLAISAFIILLISPYSLFNVGFQLSFGCVAALIYFFNRNESLEKIK